MQQLVRRAGLGPLIIDEIIYAEVAARASSQHRLDKELHELGIDFHRISRHALFHAAKAFQRYRATGGSRPGILPDFFIGAHARAAGLPILTRDPRRYRTYFPEVELITPFA
jgi:predicted nucleic acid-binding protein